MNLHAWIPRQTMMARTFCQQAKRIISCGLSHSFCGTAIRTLAEKDSQDYFTLSDLGVKGLYLPPGYPKLALISITGGFSIYGQPGTPGYTNSTGYQLTEDVSTVRGAHQIGFGA